MRPKPLKQQPQDQLFKNRLCDELNPEHELIRLGKVIPWDQIQADVEPLFTEGQSRPPLPAQLAIGLMILQHLYNVSDEEVVRVWVENPYWQAFCGYEFLQWEFPAHPTSLTRWRQRLGPEGLEQVLKVSIGVALKTKTVTATELEKAIADTTVMPKAITHPNDAKLIQRIIERIVKASDRAGIALKRTFTRVSKRALQDYQRLMHGKRTKKAQRPLRRLRRYLSKILKDLDPHLESCPRDLFKEMVVGARLLIQEKEGKNKIYSCHEPQVSCIAKGKAHKPYEFGAKACLVVTEKTGLALTLTTHVGSPYDGHLLEEALCKAEGVTGIEIKRVLVDLGFRGHEVTNKQVLISRTKGLIPSLKKALKRRQAIEPWIGHMKSDGKLGRCYLKGPTGDKIHGLLVAIAHNFRTILRKLRLFYAWKLEWVMVLVGRLLEVDERRRASDEAVLMARA
jgi:IS5 family transposase